MDISPYLRKPLRSLQEVEETRRPREVGDGAAAVTPELSGKPADEPPSTSEQIVTIAG